MQFWIRVTDMRTVRLFIALSVLDLLLIIICLSLNVVLTVCVDNSVKTCRVVYTRNMFILAVKNVASIAVPIRLLSLVEFL